MINEQACAKGGGRFWQIRRRRRQRRRAALLRAPPQIFRLWHMPDEYSRHNYFVKNSGVLLGCANSSFNIASSMNKTKTAAPARCCSTKALCCLSLEDLKRLTLSAKDGKSSKSSRRTFRHFV